VQLLALPNHLERLREPLVTGRLHTKSKSAPRNSLWQPDLQCWGCPLALYRSGADTWRWIKLLTHPLLFMEWEYASNDSKMVASMQ